MNFALYDWFVVCCLFAHSAGYRLCVGVRSCTVTAQLVCGGLQLSQDKPVESLVHKNWHCANEPIKVPALGKV